MLGTLTCSHRPCSSPGTRLLWQTPLIVAAQLRMYQTTCAAKPTAAYSHLQTFKRKSAMTLLSIRGIALFPNMVSEGYSESMSSQGQSTLPAKQLNTQGRCLSRFVIHPPVAIVSVRNVNNTKSVRNTITCGLETLCPRSLTGAP